MTLVSSIFSAGSEHVLMMVKVLPRRVTQPCNHLLKIYSIALHCMHKLKLSHSAIF